MRPNFRGKINRTRTRKKQKERRGLFIELINPSFYISRASSPSPLEICLMRKVNRICTFECISFFSSPSTSLTITYECVCVFRDTVTSLFLFWKEEVSPYGDDLRRVAFFPRSRPRTIEDRARGYPRADNSPHALRGFRRGFTRHSAPPVYMFTRTCARTHVLELHVRICFLSEFFRMSESARKNSCRGFLSG